jgi:hypothetical protein
MSEGGKVMNDAYTKTTADVGLAQRNGLAQLTMETRAAVAAAGIVLVPDDGFRDYPGPVFPHGTVEFLQFVRDHAPSDTTVAIAVEEAEYKEVVLHSDIVRLATMFVEYVAAPMAVSLIAAYLKDFLGSRFGRVEARAAIVVLQKEGDIEQTVRVSYEGPAPNAEQALRDAIASLNTTTIDTPSGARTVTTGAKPQKLLGKRKNTKRRK